MSSDTAASCLLDVVVFAGGDSLDLMPLSTVEQKTMLRICNRPLIWYTLTPWIDAGFATFFLCVNEDYAALRAYLSRAFSGVDFHYILVPSKVGDHASTTCDAVKAYLCYKEALRLGEEGPLIASADVGEREASPASTERAGSTSGTRDALRHRGSGAGATAGSNARRSTTGGSRDPLKLERVNSAGLPRDAILLSCDSILVDVDIASFVERHYTSLASVTSMLYRPLRKRAGEQKGGGGRGKGAAAAAAAAEAPQASFTHAFSCVAYEENDATSSMALGTPCGAGSGSALTSYVQGGGQSGQHTRATSPSSSKLHGSAAAAEEESHVSHHRLHYIYPLEGKPEVRITMAFAARRPDLTFAADVVEAHVYLVSRWVLDFIAASAGIADMMVRKDIIPLLARSQHTMVNASEKSFVTPSEKLHTNISLHWTGEGADLSVQSLNAARGLPLPEVTDPLRVFCSIYEEHPDVACRIYRMNTRDNYRALHHEIISAKCFQLQLDEPAAQTGGGAAPSRRSAPPSLLQHHGTFGHHGGPQDAHADSKPSPSLGALALAALLPDNPITIKEKIADQQVYIVSSFIDSVPPPNVFITRSVIGAHVKLEAGARITDSILMGNVEVGAKAVIAHSVIGTGAVVNAECRIGGTIVAPRCVVEENAQDTIIE
ncbi:hypothetical protein ABB37_01537 [Leptomonas pyrrhocoris]|uniref:Translation initiation factor eIF2B subunit gamma n=1 Tax=Leptomonas pyrrhocoris TaxID=157538 RepID=A0A0N0DZG2_LEPPY|nr:hypothetical protein ABB37_01537 [Leptomonas pyrrhocoris]KPA85162.1 hypothetical protein ABB37_01537 [Leptomonas pyrrhocoris]|eukprot:XP_015663601.1 hypothetical protein ABB37_01537 [Leptomonas pyrrhocoris]